MLRPRRVRATRLLAAQLAHFATPKTWPEIFSLTPRMLRIEWRQCVMCADEHGEGFLRWDVSNRTWNLTDKGRAFVALIQGDDRMSQTFPTIEVDIACNEELCGGACGTTIKPGDTMFMRVKSRTGSVTVLHEPGLCDACGRAELEARKTFALSCAQKQARL